MRSTNLFYTLFPGTKLEGTTMRSLSMALILLLLVQLAIADEPAKLPKVVLIGDSIRLGYGPEVAKKLEGKAIIISPGANGGDSSNVLKNLDGWAVKEQPD